MNFRIADTFTDSLAKLGNTEQKIVKTTVFDLQIDPTGQENSGLRMHRLHKSRDKHFWSVSANMDLRIIIHRQGDSTLVCYVDHHDDAYAWAANRRLEVHPNTGAAQLVEIAEVSREIEVPVYVAPSDTPPPAAAKKQPPLADKDGSWLMLYGIPEEWIDRLKAATEDELLELVDHLPAEAAEAVIDIATGNAPPIPVKTDPAVSDPFEHPDAQRRFRTIESKEELEAALEAPWDKWTIFLHPSQRELVSRSYSGPARVSGSAGTGKTVVAIHRAVYLARTDEDARVLLTTFSDVLANNLRKMLHRLLQHEPQLGERIDVAALDTRALKLFRATRPTEKLATEAEVEQILRKVADATGHDFTWRFLRKEWHTVVDAWQLRTWEAYRDVRRIGRRTRLSAAKREAAWSIFEQVFARLDEKKLITLAGVYDALTKRYADGQTRSPYAHVVVDEAQDISVSQLRFLATLVGDRADGLFFARDLGQRIFQAPFSWSALGVEVRGRASTLRINYRTSHQIRRQADRLLHPEIEDVDGNKELRNNTQSVFNGPAPIVNTFHEEAEETAGVAAWLRERAAEGIAPSAIAVFVRAAEQLDRGRAALEASGLPYGVLSPTQRPTADQAVLSTMHLAKGLEYKAVAVIACDEGVIPDESRIASVQDMPEIEEVYDTERHLLYVACTRARDYLWVSCAGTGSEFLADFE